MSPVPPKLASRRRASPEARRTEIFRSLGLVLRERGLASLTMQEIADRLGMTKGNLYYYFKDEQDLLYRCHVRAMRLSLRALERGEFRKVDARLAGFAILGAINWIPKWYNPRGELGSAAIADAFADFLVGALEA